MSEFWDPNNLATARDVLPVTPSDTVDLPDGVRCLLIGTAGNLQVTTAAGEIRALTNVPVGYFMCQVSRVWATNTTATNIGAFL